VAAVAEDASVAGEALRVVASLDGDHESEPIALDVDRLDLRVDETVCDLVVHRHAR